MHRVLPGVVFALFPALLAALSGLAVAWFFVSDAAGVGWTVLWVVSVAVLGATGAAVVAMLRHSPDPVEGHVVTRTEQPRLWSEVDTLAHGVDTEPPTRLVVSDEVNASVSAWRDSRELVIGLPLLATFTVAELRFVLAHELAHHAGGHRTEQSRQARRMALFEAVDQHANPTWRWLLRLWAQVYALSSAPLVRERERQADALATRLTGADAGSAALRKLVAVSMLWDERIETLPSLAAAVGHRGSLTIAIQETLAHTPADFPAAVDDAIAHEPTSLLDAHPPVRERLHRLSGPPGSAEEIPATDWLTGGADWLASIEHDLWPDDRPAMDWPTILQQWFALETDMSAQSLVRVMRNRGVAPTVRTLLDQLAEPGALSWIEGDEDARVEVLTDVVLAALLSQGLASVLPHSFRDGDRVADRAGTVLPVERWVREALRDGGPDALRTPLQGVGLDLDRAVAPFAKGNAILVSIGLAVVDGQRMDVHCFSSGVLLLPATSDVVRAAKRADDSSAEERRLADTIITHDVARLRELPGARWIPLRELHEIRATGMLGLGLEFRLTDGSVVRCRATTCTTLIPEDPEEFGTLLAMLA